VIAVVASRLDPESRSVVADWSTADAALLSAEDLTSAGWTFNVGDARSGSAVIDGRRIKTAEITAVLTRRPSVLPEELTRIHPDDRAYVAAETNAFLVAWLSALPCVVVNRPTTTSLCGPLWDALHWRCAATAIGLPWSDDDAADAHDVVVCGEQCVFARSTEEASAAIALARSVGTDLLGVQFRRGRISAVSVTPSLADRDVRACLLDHLRQRS
jgi:hypothetical protein